jgi:guanylate kinase
VSNIITITGPSGVGKTTLESFLGLQEGIPAAVSYTSRDIRPGEAHGQNYFYVERRAIEQMVRSGEAVEHAEYSGNLYALTRAELEKADTVVAVVDRHGLDCIQEKFENVFAILIVPASGRQLRERLEARGDDPDVIEKRLATAAAETAVDRDFDLVIVSHHPPSMAVSVSNKARSFFSGQLPKTPAEAVELAIDHLKAGKSNRALAALQVVSPRYKGDS